MTSTAPYFDIEVQTPVAGVFVLDHSEVGGTDLLGDDPTAGFQWTSIKCDATRIETWRGAQVEGAAVTADVGTLSVVTVVDPSIISDDDLQTGAKVRLRAAGDHIDTLATFTITNARVSENKLKDQAHLELTATDAVSTLANTIRYGAATPTGDGEPWPARVSRLMATANVPTAPPQDPPLVIALVNNPPAAEEHLWPGANWTLTTDDGVPVLAAWSGTAVRTLDGLTPGSIYRIEVDLKSDNVATDLWLGDGWDDHEKATAAGHRASIWLEPAFGMPGEGTLAFEFIATNPTEKVTLNVPSDLGITRVRLMERQRIPWCANIVTETNLARHLDIATATAGLGWYVDRDGITRIAAGDGPALAHFSDVHDTEDPLHVCYTHVTPAWGTEDVVNDLRLDNITRRRNDDDTAWEDATTALGPYRDRLSAARWGSRAASIETSIYTPPPGDDGYWYSDPDTPPMLVGGALDYQDTAEHLAAGHLARLANPKPRFREVTFTATDFPDLTAALDLYSRVEVERNEVSQPSSVVSIAHTITPTRWTTTLGLLEQE